MIQLDPAGAPGDDDNLPDDEPAPLTLRERALAAWMTAQEAEAAERAAREQREAERRAAARAKRIADFRQQLEKRGFGQLDVDDDTAVIEGVTLQLRYWRDGTGLVAVARCAECGEVDGEEWDHVQTLASFGRVLAEWLPAHADHRCETCVARERRREDDEREAAWERREAERRAAKDAEPPPPAPTLEERLFEALVAVIDSRIASRTEEWS